MITSSIEEEQYTGTGTEEYRKTLLEAKKLLQNAKRLLVDFMEQ
jgi:hypothetical protein